MKTRRRRPVAAGGAVIPGNARPSVSTDYTAPHPLSVRIVNAWAQRHNLETRGLGGVIRFGMNGGPSGAHQFSGELGPHQAFRGAASFIGNVDVASGIVTGLPSPQPPGGRVPTIFDLMRDMDTRANAGLVIGGGPTT